MNYSISISGYADPADETAADLLEQSIQAAAKTCIAALPGVQAASVSTDRNRVVDVKKAG